MDDNFSVEVAVGELREEVVKLRGEVVEAIGRLEVIQAALDALTTQ